MINIFRVLLAKLGLGLDVEAEIQILKVIYSRFPVSEFPLYCRTMLKQKENICPRLNFDILMLGHELIQ